MAATKDKPIGVRRGRCAGEPKSLIDEHEPIGVSVCKCESILVLSRAGGHAAETAVNQEDEIVRPVPSD